MIRVGVIGPQDPDSFADNIADSVGGFEDMEAVRLGTPRPAFRNRKISALYDVAAKGAPRVDEKVQARIARRVIDAECDLVINVQHDLMPGTVATIRAAGIPVVLWFPDAISNMGRGMMFAADYTMLYLKDPELVARVTGVQGLRAKYLPEAFNPRWHNDEGGKPGDDPGMVLAGNIYSTRATLLRRLQADGVPLRLYGASIPTWMPNRNDLSTAHAGESITRQEKANVFRRAQAVLNNLHPSEMTSMNCRLFEAAGSGACVITEHRPSLDSLFRVGEQVLSFSTYDELLKHWHAIEDDPELPVRVGQAAMARALTEHTYFSRLSQIFADTL